MSRTELDAVSQELLGPYVTILEHEQIQHEGIPMNTKNEQVSCTLLNTHQ